MNKSLLSKYIENLCVLTSDFKQNESFLSISVILKKIVLQEMSKTVPVAKAQIPQNPDKQVKMNETQLVKLKQMMLL